MWHRFNIVSRRTEIHDAETQSVLSVYYSIRYERLAASLNGHQQPLIQVVQIILDRFGTETGAKFLRDVTQCGDAEVVGDCLEFGMIRRQVIQVLRQSNVVLNHLAVTCCPRVLQSEPDFERAKSTRVL